MADPALQDDQQLKNVLLRAGAEVSTVDEQSRERSLTTIPEDATRLTSVVRSGSGGPVTGEVRAHAQSHEGPLGCYHCLGRRLAGQVKDHTWSHIMQCPVR